MVLIKTLEEKYNISYQNDRTSNTNAEWRYTGFMGWTKAFHKVRYNDLYFERC